MATLYVVCNRRLNAETNEHCEYDGEQQITNGRWVCPGCRAAHSAPRD
ncbi:hypothetical protein [Cryobacterium sp. Hh11]|nr:hypothetical protein [Cryobacterium sp. Hh11]